METMRGFAARTNDGTAAVRISFADDGQALVRRNGTTIAAGVPEVVPRGTDDGRLVCFTTAQWEGRTATSITTPTADGSTLQNLDVAVARTSTIFAAEGLPPLWGARLTAGQVRGWAYVEGIASLETWTVDLVPIPKRCCGKPGPPPSPTIELPALAWEVS